MTWVLWGIFGLLITAATVSLALAIYGLWQYCKLVRKYKDDLQDWPGPR